MTAEPVDRRRVLLVGAAATLVITATGLTAYAYGGDVPRGTRVLGVELGGKSRTDAERTLHDRLDPRAGEPVEVVLDGRPMSIAPAAISMTLNVEETVGRAMRSGQPVLFGQRTCPPVVRLDRAQLVAVLGGRIDKDRIDRDQAVAAVRAAWLTGQPAVIPAIS